MAETADNGRVLTGAIAIIKVQGIPVGKMRSIRYSENMRRMPVRGIGTIFASELAVVEWDGQLTCDFFEIRFQTTGIKNAILRNFTSSRSRIADGLDSFEDQLVLEQEGVQIDIFKKVTDVIDPATKIIKPKAVPYAVIGRAFIESDGFDISESGISGHNQSFKCLDPILSI